MLQAEEAAAERSLYKEAEEQIDAEVKRQPRVVLKESPTHEPCSKPETLLVDRQ